MPQTKFQGRVKRGKAKSFFNAFWGSAVFFQINVAAGPSDTYIAMEGCQLTITKTKFHHTKVELGDQLTIKVTLITTPWSGLYLFTSLEEGPEIHKDAKE